MKIEARAEPFPTIVGRLRSREGTIVDEAYDVLVWYRTRVRALAGSDPAEAAMAAGMLRYDAGNRADGVLKKI